MQSEVLFAFQAALVIISAKFTGRLFERKLKQPAVIGEVTAGLFIGPFALGGLVLPAFALTLPVIGTIGLPALGPLFRVGPGGIFDSGLLLALTTTGAVVLMFDAGLETNLKRFLAFAPAGFTAGLGGAVLSFGLGAGAAVLTGYTDSFLDTRALILGAIATATSVGITVRVLSDLRRLNSPEGSTVLSAAVIDDVIALVFLSLVVSMGTAVGGATIPWGRAGLLSLKAVIVFCSLLGAGLLFKRRISGLLMKLGSLEAAGAVALGIGLLAAGIAEASGLALIVGAYVMGLSLSETDIVHVLHNALEPVRELLVPVLFCVTGMMADLSGIGPVIIFGLVYTIMTGFGKVVGCGLPSIPFGFNFRGAMRIGVSMLPRQEVALIAAGLALSKGLIGTQEMGVVIIMMVATTVATPPLLAGLYRGGPGLKRKLAPLLAEPMTLRIPLPAEDLAVFITEHAVEIFRAEGFYIFRLPVKGRAWDIRREERIVSLGIESNDIVITAAGCESMEYARQVFSETISDLKRVLGEFEATGDKPILRLLYGLGEGCVPPAEGRGSDTEETPDP